MPKWIVIYDDKAIKADSDSGIISMAKIEDSNLASLSKKELFDIIKCVAQNPEGGVSIVEG